MKYKKMVLLLLLVLSGCSALISKTEQYTPLSSPETFSKDKALIVVTRKQENNASAHEVEVTDNGKPIGLLGVGTLSIGGSIPNTLIWERDPGKINLQLTPKFIVSDLSVIEEDIKAGVVYYYDVRFGYSPYGLQLIKSKYQTRRALSPSAELLEHEKELDDSSK